MKKKKKINLCFQVPNKPPLDFFKKKMNLKKNGKNLLGLKIQPLLISEEILDWEEVVDFDEEEEEFDEELFGVSGFPHEEQNFEFVLSSLALQEEQNFGIFLN